MDVAGGVLDHRATAVVPDDGVVAGARYRPERFVVGVDGSLGVLAAVSWAAGEAAATRTGAAEFLHPRGGGSGR